MWRTSLISGFCFTQPNLYLERIYGPRNWHDLPFEMFNPKIVSVLLLLLFEMCPVILKLSVLVCNGQAVIPFRCANTATISVNSSQYGPPEHYANKAVVAILIWMPLRIAIFLRVPATHQEYRVQLQDCQRIPKDCTGAVSLHL